MNPGIFYLYEYENNKRRRNVGFIKISRRYQTCILQIHVRGISTGNGASLELYAFYRAQDAIVGSKIAVLNCFGKNISARLPISERNFPEGRPLSEIDGFLIKLPVETPVMFWMASSTFFPIDLGTFRTPVYPEIPSSDPQSDTSSPKEAGRENTAPELPASESDIPVPDITSVPSVPQPSEGLPAREGTQAPEGSPDPEETQPPEGSPAPGKTQSPEDTPSQEETKLPNPDCSSSDVDLIEQEKSGISLCEPAEDKKKAKKIQRSDISSLPRRFWFLANNSFLLHGYHNYNHLLLAEEKGRLWLGVPGIYDPREAKAADLFGFPQFTRTYVPVLALEPGECSENPDFGYWCRCVGAGSIKK